MNILKKRKLFENNHILNSIYSQDLKQFIKNDSSSSINNQNNNGNLKKNKNKNYLLYKIRNVKNDKWKTSNKYIINLLFYFIIFILLNLSNSNFQIYIEISNTNDFRRILYTKNIGNAANIKLNYSVANVNLYKYENDFLLFNCEKYLCNITLTWESVSNTINGDEMFKDCNVIQRIKFPSTQQIYLSSMDLMFYNCSSLYYLNLSNVNTEKITNMSYLFYNCISLSNLKIYNLNTTNVINMNSMFYNCKRLNYLHLENFNTRNVEDMEMMFYNCKLLYSLNLSSFYTPKVTNMNSMFFNCSSLYSLNLINFDTSNVINMNSMFYHCSSLYSLNLIYFDASKVTNMNSMFYNCSSLKSISFGSSFNSFNVEDMSYMFAYCSGFPCFLIVGN